MAERVPTYSERWKRDLAALFGGEDAETVAGAPQAAVAPMVMPEAPQTNINQMNAQALALSSQQQDPTPPIPPIANPYDDPEYRALQEQGYGKIRESIDLQRAREQDAQKLLQDYMGQEQQIDLSPLLAYIDSSYGGNLSKGYQRPMSKEERMLKGADLQDIIRKAGAGVSEKELELLRAQMGDKKSEAEILANQQYRRDLLAAQKAKSEKKTKIDELPTKDRLKIKADFQKQYGQNIQGLAQMAGQAKQLENILNEVGQRPGVFHPRRKDYTSAVSQMVLAYNKDFAGLGALAGPDLGILTSALGGVQPNDLTEDYLSNLLTDPNGQKTKEVMTAFQGVIDRIVDGVGGLQREQFEGLTDELYEENKKQYKEKIDQISGKKPGAADPRVEAFMKANNITDKAQAEKILRDAGKL